MMGPLLALHRTVKGSARLGPFPRPDPRMARLTDEPPSIQ
mgnify:CR=1 FL=1